jgi:hypothetical protein
MRAEQHTERRILVAAMRQAAIGRTRETSLRQLPTDHDHVGELYRSIHEYQSDQPSLSARSALVRVLRLSTYNGGL